MIVSRACIVLALGLAAPAAPAARADEPPPLPPRVEEAARAVFAEAQAADRAGDLVTAIDRYRQLQKIAPHPNITYNLADVLRRKRDLRGAAREYRAYLRQDPTAADRRKVEQVIRQLEATPGQLDVSIKGDAAVVFVDGKRQAPADKLFLELAPGPHRFDAVSRISFRSLTHAVDFARSSSFTLSLPARADGNLLVSGSGWLERAKVTIDGATPTRLGAAVEVVAGDHTVVVERDGCTWSKRVAVPTDAIVYVYVDVPGPPPPPIEPPRTKPARPAPPAPAVCRRATVAVERVVVPVAVIPPG
ncbi:MAG: hypothetical protein R3B06_06135 [Kofleriaceae bacterium]